MSVLISTPRRRGNRIVAAIEGNEVFFESDLPLLRAPELFLCPFLAPAMKRGAGLSVRGPVDPVLLENLHVLRRQFTEWWPELSNGAVHAKKSWWFRPEYHRPPDRSGLFYTGGVDSAWSLQQLHSRLSLVVFVEGFDIPLADAARLAAARRLLASTVAECGIRLATVRTNLREHPLFNEISWEITHAAALAGIAHAMSNLINRMYISASNFPPPWGSTPELDRFWSSSRVQIEHFGAENTRLDRVISLAGWQPIRGRLRVCWKNQSADLNCGYCEKCLRTRLELLAAGASSALDSFPQGFPLPETIRRLDFVTPAVRGQWQELVPRLDDPDLRYEINCLLERSCQSA